MSIAMHIIKLKMGGGVLGGSSLFHVRCSLVTTLGVPGSLLLLSVVGVDLVALGVQFDNFGSLRAPVPDLVFPWGFMLDWDRKAWTSRWYLVSRSPALK